MAQYSSKHVREAFEVSHQTVKNWCEAFADFLSPTATPGKGRQRTFTDDDMRVFAFISDAKNNGLLYDEIRLSLQNGQRGDMPQVDQDIVPAPSGKMMTLQRALDTALTENNKLQTQLERADANIGLLQRQLSEAQSKIDNLNREIGRLQAQQEKQG